MAAAQTITTAAAIERADSAGDYTGQRADRAEEAASDSPVSC